MRAQRDTELAHRVVDALVGELEAAEMCRDAEPGAEIQMGANGLVRVHVLLLHEPARLVGADRQQRHVHDSATTADLRELRAVPRVAGEIHGSIGRFDHEPAPQRPIAIRQSTARPMLRGCAEHARGPYRYGLPPVELSNATEPVLRQKRTIPEAGHEQRLMRAFQTPQRVEIEVVVMIVADQHQVDTRKLLERQPGRTNALRSSPRRPDSLVPTTRGPSAR